MEVLTRHAPVPQASIIMPSRPTTEALAWSPASLMGTLPSLAPYSCQRISIWFFLIPFCPQANPVITAPSP